jgi:prepilin-type N-terminal cleavage/methylation domain-containing protein
MHKKTSGFTLIELVTVIVLVAIFSVYAVAKWPSDSALKLPAQAELFAAHIQHIQALAMDWSQPLRLTTNSNGYSVSCVTASTGAPCNSSPVIDPATNETFSVSLEPGISLSGSATTDFDTLGRPVSAGALITTSPARSFILSANGINQTVTVAPLTGFSNL